MQHRHAAAVMPAVRVSPARRVIVSSTYRAREQAYTRSVKQQCRPAQSCVRAGGLTRKIWCLFGVYLVLMQVEAVFINL